MTSKEPKVALPLSGFSTLSLDEPGSLAIQGQPSNRSPISKLHPDILWKIFLMNANMFDDIPGSRAFNHTVRASQVCHEWRDFIISSPSLWARIIDLTIFFKSHEDLFNEVMRRTGTAALSIKGDIYANYPGNDETYSPAILFFSLLNDEWTRIRVLDIRLRIAYGFSFQSFLNGIFNPSSWHAIRLPAPSLEIFRLHVPKGSDFQIPHPHKIFGNSAPLLREFKFPTFAIGIETPWLGHLRHLNLSFALSQPQMLGILEKTPLLEVLIFDEEATMFIPNTKDQRVSLPRLIEIKVLNAREHALYILQHIIPAPGCSLLLSSEDLNMIMYHGKSIVKSVISRYAQCYFNNDDPTLAGPKLKLYLALYKQSFGFSHESNAFFTPYLPKYTLYASSTKNDLLGELFILFLESLSSCKLNNLETLHLSIVLNNKMPPIDPFFKSFFLSFSSVKTLQTTPDILQFLLEIPKKDCIVLPSLRTVEIVDSRQWLDREYVLLFLLWRVEIDIPIETLDLVQCRNVSFTHLKFLGQMEGLKVRWKNEDELTEFVCGNTSSIDD